MNLNLNYEGFEKFLLKRISRDTELMGYVGIQEGVQYIFKFDNGFGASVIKRWSSYGHEDDLWELGVITFDRYDEWELTYDTPITGDVIGYRTDEEIRNLLKEIKEL